jgi:hypothetical protein
VLVNDNSGQKRPADLPAPDDLPGRRPKRLSDVHPGGRREYTLTLDEVAAILKVHVKTVRKLIRCQYEEDKAAALESRKPRALGLRALYVTSKVRRVTEHALGEYLNPPREHS